MGVGRPTALLGMHLCGNLSLRAIDAFERLASVQIVVLSPCCLPAKADPASPPNLFLTKDSTEQYNRWGSYLEDRLRNVAPEGTVVTHEVALDILSPKNIVLCATKPVPK